MVARDGVEPPTPAFFRATLCCSLNNLSDSRWPPKYLRRRERHANRGLKSWVQSRIRKRSSRRDEPVRRLVRIDSSVEGALTPHLTRPTPPARTPSRRYF